jgi:transcriptional regulator with XRE-family HTH domain/catechol 2,3-dioxygenase-like lactoylglutathione lyase family enzyme
MMVRAEKFSLTVMANGGIAISGSRPTAFHHVSLVVTDLDRSLAFYSGLLGLELRSRTRCEMGRLRIAGTGVDWPGSDGDWPTEPVDVVLLELNGVRIELARPLHAGASLSGRGPGAAVDAPSRADRPVSSSSHVALKVSDVRSLRRELEAAEVRFLTPLLVFPEEGHRPWIWCRCEDPDGHQVELVEEMPASYQLERMAERLREARAQRSLTLKEVAAQSSISVAHLSQVERGETIPSVPTLLSISSSLGVAPDYFFRAMTDNGAAAAAGQAARSQSSREDGGVDWQWLTPPHAGVRLLPRTLRARRRARSAGGRGGGECELRGSGRALYWCRPAPPATCSPPARVCPTTCRSPIGSPTRATFPRSVYGVSMRSRIQRRGSLNVSTTHNAGAVALDAITLDVNGEVHQVVVEPQWTLQYVLMDRLGSPAPRSSAPRARAAPAASSWTGGPCWPV